MANSQPFLERFGFRRDEYHASRKYKVGKILKILFEEIARPKESVIADIGCSEGHITQFLVEHFRFVVGVDIDAQGSRPQSYQFVQADGCCLPFADRSFDIVLLNHILEHVASQQSLLDEAWRILKPSGICYLAVPNRLWILEPHYLLPFLSWLPRSVASTYVRLTKRGAAYSETLPSYWSIRRMSKKFGMKDLTSFLLRAPETFYPDDPDLLARTRYMKWLPEPLLKMFIPLVPSWVFILRKR